MNLVVAKSLSSNEDKAQDIHTVQLRRLVSTVTEEERNIEIIDSSASYPGFYESFMSETK